MYKEKSSGLIIGMDCVLQTVDKSCQLAGISVGTKKIQATIKKAYVQQLLNYSNQQTWDEYEEPYR